GKATVDFGGFEVANALALRPNGDIVLAGHASSPTTSNNFAVAELDANGAPVAFRTTVADIGGNDDAEAVALQPDGKIVVAGYTSQAAGFDFAIARINTNGVFDTSFGTGGKTRVDFGGDDLAFGVALQKDGKIVVAGSTSKGAVKDDLAVARLNANGSPD